jgi:hypothetical protein
MTGLPSSDHNPAVSQVSQVPLFEEVQLIIVALYSLRLIRLPEICGICSSVRYLKWCVQLTQRPECPDGSGPVPPATELTVTVMHV